MRRPGLQRTARVAVALLLLILAGGTTGAANHATAAVTKVPSAHSYDWINLTKNLSTSPPVMSGASMVFDTKDRYLLLYGSFAGTNAASVTWKYTGAGWVRVWTHGSPPSLDLYSMAYDTQGGDALLFGGNMRYHSNTNKTWEYSGGNWTRSTSIPSPSGRSEPTMAYDTGDKAVILFGGCGPGRAYTCRTLDSDTWSFSGGNWTQLFPVGSPLGGFGSAFTYDPAQNATILFGGCTAFSGGVCTGVSATTWEFQGGNWSPVKIVGGSPPGEYGADMAWAPALHGLLLFGGAQPNGTALNQTWLYQNHTWSRLLTAHSPPGRTRFAMAYDSRLGELLLFGGSTVTSGLGDTWVLR